MAEPTRLDPPMIVTRELARTFKTRGGVVEAVRGVDLRVEAGEIFGFLGPNGAGKTTTLRMLTTLMPPTAGEATVAGADLRREPQEVRRRIGYVPQGGSTDVAETGRGELVIQGRLYGMSRADAKARASGGARRARPRGRGRSLHRDILGRDEAAPRRRPRDRPSARRPVPRRADDRARSAGAGPGCGTRSSASASEGTTVFLTTHYLEEADALCDRLAIIDQGRIVAEGTSDELKRPGRGRRRHDRRRRPGRAGHRARGSSAVRPRDRRRATTTSSGSTSTAARRPCRSSSGFSTRPGSRATSISLHKPSLDDVFLRQTGRSLRDESAAA